MVLDELLGRYKNELMKTLCSNEKIVRLVTDSSEASVPNYDLAYSKIFPFEFVPETVETGGTFICFDVDISETERSITKTASSEDTFYFPVLYIWAFSHKSKLRLMEGGIRTDELAIEINKTLCGNWMFGLGKLKLYSIGRFSPIEDYQGRVLTYAARDFNLADRSRKPPANRKTNE